MAVTFGLGSMSCAATVGPAPASGPAYASPFASGATTAGFNGGPADDVSDAFKGVVTVAGSYHFAAEALGVVVR